ncbi:MAG TPA: hypothetical protein DDW90_05835 [Cyanobacteria bacterium UBA9971]|nr:hypothetical protein [Cyanobacteria bacterium UBA9971]
MTGLETDKIVFKPMSYEELSISLERLQRFNNPFRKFDRVYREILIKHLVFPKISLKNYYKFSFGTLNFLAQLIWNESVRILNPAYSKENKENYGINSYLFYEETKEFSAKEMLKRIVFSESVSGFAMPANFAESDFICDENVLKNIFEQVGINFENKYLEIQNLDIFSRIYIAVKMNYPINIDGFLQFADKQKDISQNIKRLIWLNNQIKKSDLAFDFEKTYKLAENYRNQNRSRKPLKLIVLVEGATEEVLLPLFSSVAGIDFEKTGIELVAAGGKNQVARIYAEINLGVNLPIFIILDADAQEIADEIRKIIRQQDRLYLISGGEFEDILPDELICRATNSYYGLTGKINKEEISINGRKTVTLANLWKQKGFGEFKKAEFAQIIAENIKTSADLSEEMQKIILNIREMISK